MCTTTSTQWQTQSTFEAATTNNGGKFTERIYCEWNNEMAKSRPQAPKYATAAEALLCSSVTPIFQNSLDKFPIQLKS